VLGAGAVGLAIGARLARAGLPVLLVARREEAARALREQGVRFEDPARGEAWGVRVEAVAQLDAALARIGAEALLLCTRASETAALARALAQRAPRACVASVQNDVDNEAARARHFARVLGVVFRATATREGETTVRSQLPGRVVVGAWPAGLSPEAVALARDLEAAGFDVGRSERIAEDKWLKLAINLMSAPNALVRREDHATPAFAQGKARLLEEARDAFRAAGVVARSCDGRDRSLEEEIAWQRGAVERGTSARRLPLYNQVWAALRRGAPVEADAYHRRILELARSHDLDAPCNARVLEALLRAARGGLGPECTSATELFGPPGSG
jgi:2-dehydropantoate 2-reductase